MCNNGCAGLLQPESEAGQKPTPPLNCSFLQLLSDFRQLDILLFFSNYVAIFTPVIAQMPRWSRRFEMKRRSVRWRIVPPCCAWKAKMKADQIYVIQKYQTISCWYRPIRSGSRMTSAEPSTSSDLCCHLLVEEQPLSYTWTRLSWVCVCVSVCVCPPAAVRCLAVHRGQTSCPLDSASCQQGSGQLRLEHEGQRVSPAAQMGQKCPPGSQLRHRRDPNGPVLTQTRFDPPVRRTAAGKPSHRESLGSYSSCRRVWSLQPGQGSPDSRRKKIRGKAAAGRRQTALSVGSFLWFFNLFLCPSVRFCLTVLCGLLSLWQRGTFTDPWRSRLFWLQI